GTIIQALDELGYVVEWGLFNSKFWGVPQNRERVFILATRKDIFRQPKLIELLNEQTEVNTRLLDLIEDEVDEKYFLSDERVEQLKFNDKVQKGDIKQVAQYDTDKRENSNRFRTYDVEGIGPGLSTMCGGGLEPCITGLSNTSKTGYRSHDVHGTNGISPTIAARDYKGAKQIAVPVLTPDRVNKRQNGRRFKEDGEPMFTLTSQDRHGVLIKEATKKGYSEANEGDSVNYQYPDSETRRGRVGKQVANTLEASGVNQGVVIKNEEIDVVGNIYKSQGQAGKVYTTNGLSPTVQ